MTSQMKEVLKCDVCTESPGRACWWMPWMKSHPPRHHCKRYFYHLTTTSFCVPCFFLFWFIAVLCSLLLSLAPPPPPKLNPLPFLNLTSKPVWSVPSSPQECLLGLRPRQGDCWEERKWELAAWAGARFWKIIWKTQVLGLDSVVSDCF